MLGKNSLLRRGSNLNAMIYLLVDGLWTWIPNLRVTHAVLGYGTLVMLTDLDRVTQDVDHHHAQEETRLHGRSSSHCTQDVDRHAQDEALSCSCSCRFW